MREAKERLADFQLAAHQASDADQASTQQSERARFRDDDVGVATGNLGRAVEKALAGVDGQLNCNTVGRKLSERSAQNACQRVVVSAVCQGNQLPTHRTAEGAAKNGSIWNAVGSIAGDREGSTRSEGAAHLQGTARQRAGGKVYRAQIARDQAAAVQAVYRNQGRTR